jgi:Asp-tRNA(Asn)/Glu-tRNA(Gln) amidotransferase A subunit family amidase
MWQVHGAQARSDPAHFGPDTLRLLELASQTSESAYRSAYQQRDELTSQTASVYDQAAVVLSPAVPFVAPTTTPPMDTAEGAAEGLFTRVFNLTGSPALVLQCGWSRAGLPIALQLSAARGADSALLGAAARIEQILDIPRREPAVR